MSAPVIDLEHATFEDAEAVEEKPTRTRKPRSDRGQPRGSGRRASTTSLEEDLLVPWATLAGALAFTAPTAAAVLITRGEKSVKALVGIAKKHPKMLAALKQAQTVTDAAELGQTALLVGMGVAMDFGRMPADHPMAQMLGLSALYFEARGIDPNAAVPQQPGPPDQNGFTMPPMFAGPVPA